MTLYVTFDSWLDELSDWQLASFVVTWKESHKYGYTATFDDYLKEMYAIECHKASPPLPCPPPPLQPRAVNPSL